MSVPSVSVVPVDEVDVDEVKFNDDCEGEIDDVEPGTIDCDASMEVVDESDDEVPVDVGNAVSADNAPSTSRHSRTSVVPNRESELSGLSSESRLLSKRSQMASSQFITLLSMRCVRPRSHSG